MRRAYRHKADQAGFAIKKPTHQDCPKRWNSTHKMDSNPFSKRVPLDHIMNLYNDEIGINVLSDDQWEHIATVTTFLCPPVRSWNCWRPIVKRLWIWCLRPSHISSSTRRMERQCSGTSIRPNGGWHECKASTRGEVSCSRTGYCGHVPKPTATEAERFYGDGPDHSSDSLSDSIRVLEHRCRTDSST